MLVNTQDNLDLPIAQYKPQREIEVRRTQHGRTQIRRDFVAEEMPVALVFNGISHVVMLASPHDLEDFALGFALSEGLLLHPQELYGIDVVTLDAGIEIRLEVSSACAMRLKHRRRNLAGRTGCGLCGAESLAQVKRPLPRVAALEVAQSAIQRALAQLPMHQGLQQLTGAAHAAAWCGLDGEILEVREDVGRHNALDKLLGALVRKHTDFNQGWLCITSRASFEMVQKSAMLGVACVVAVSAPTALAVQCAQEANLALAGFAREANMVAYTYAERFRLE